MKRIVFCLMALVMWVWTASAQAQEPSVFPVVFATSGDGFLNVRDQPSMKGQVVEKLWMLKTAHDFLFIKMTDAEVIKK